MLRAWIDERWQALCGPCHDRGHEVPAKVGVSSSNVYPAPYCSTHRARHTVAVVSMGADVGTDAYKLHVEAPIGRYRTGAGTCSVSWCSEPVKASGMCAPHYNAERRGIAPEGYRPAKRVKAPPLPEGLPTELEAPCEACREVRPWTVDWKTERPVCDVCAALLATTRSSGHLKALAAWLQRTPEVV